MIRPLKMAIYCFLLAFFVCLEVVAQAETFINGNIMADTVWTKVNSPYIVTETVQVLPGATLTIEPGVTIKINPGVGINIGHQLIAIGTQQEMIKFTSNAFVPAPGDWSGIRFVDSALDAEFDANGNYLSGNIIKYCIIEYATECVKQNETLQARIYCSTDSLTLWGGLIQTAWGRVKGVGIPRLKRSGFL